MQLNKAEQRAAAAADERVLARQAAAGSLMPAGHAQGQGGGCGRNRNPSNGRGRGGRGREGARQPNADNSAATLAALVALHGIVSLGDVNSVTISQTAFESWSDDESSEVTADQPTSVESVSQIAEQQWYHHTR